MRRIPDDIRKAILKQIIAGDTFRKIQREFNVALATINQIKEEAKDTIPDIEDLRKLSILLKKSNVKFTDTSRGANLLDKMNNCGISLNDLDKLIKLTETIFPEENVKREEILEAAIKLIDLEEKTSKPYLEVLKDFQKMSSKINRLKNKISRLKEEEHREEVQILNLRKTAEKLQKDNLSLYNRKNELLDNIRSEELIYKALTTQSFDIPCKHCGYLILITLPTREEAYELITNHLVGRHSYCPNCGNENLYHPDEILKQLGWLLLQSDDDYKTINL